MSFNDISNEILLLLSPYLNLNDFLNLQLTNKRNHYNIINCNFIWQKIFNDNFFQLKNDILLSHYLNSNIINSLLNDSHYSYHDLYLIIIIRVKYYFNIFDIIVSNSSEPFNFLIKVFEKSHTSIDLLALSFIYVSPTLTIANLTITDDHSIDYNHIDNELLSNFCSRILINEFRRTYSKMNNLNDSNIIFINKLTSNYLKLDPKYSIPIIKKLHNIITLWNDYSKNYIPKIDSSIRPISSFFNHYYKIISNFIISTFDDFTITNLYLLLTFLHKDSTHLQLFFKSGELPKIINDYTKELIQIDVYDDNTFQLFYYEPYFINLFEFSRSILDSNDTMIKSISCYDIFSRSFHNDNFIFNKYINSLLPKSLLSKNTKFELSQYFGQLIVNVDIDVVDLTNIIIPLFDMDTCIIAINVFGKFVTYKKRTLINNIPYERYDTHFNSILFKLKSLPLFAFFKNFKNYKFYPSAALSSYIKTISPPDKPLSMDSEEFFEENVPLFEHLSLSFSDVT